MMKQEPEASRGMYTYRHHCDNGVDIHEIFAKKSRSRALLSSIGAVLLLASVCRSLLVKGFRSWFPSVPSTSWFSSHLPEIYRPVHQELIFLVLLCQPGLQEGLCLGAAWSTSFGVLVAKCLQYKPVKKELVMIMPGFGVQLEKHFWSGRVDRWFVPIGKILKPVLNECVTPVTCYWSLALLLHDEEELMLVFEKFRPPVAMLVPVWRALCAFTSS